MKISVFGAGSWGVAIAILLHRNGHEVTLWASTPELTNLLSDTRVNPRLSDVKIPEGIEITCDTAAAAKNAQLAVVARASKSVNATGRMLAGLLRPDCVVVCVSKGIDNEPARLLSVALSETLGENQPLAALSGPAHAEEVARGVPTACVAASRSREAAELVQDAFMNDTFRVYTSDDIVGVELGGALKNVIALCAGICDGLGCGDNTIAALATRGLAEIAELVVALGGRRETVAGLAGLGDLIVTCTSRHSRNRRAGVLVGQGSTAAEAVAQVGAAVEGYYTARAVRDLAQSAGVEMPICTEAYRVLFENRDPHEVIRELMTRDKRSESENSFMGDGAYGEW